MNCTKIQQDLSAYLDDALAPAQRAEISAHLAGCPDCRKRQEELEKVAAGITALPTVPVPAGFGDDVRLKIRAEAQQSAHGSWFDVLFRPLWLKLPVEALAVVAAVAAITVLHRPSVPPPQPDSGPGYVTPMAKIEQTLTPPSAAAPKAFHARIEEPVVAAANEASTSSARLAAPPAEGKVLEGEMVAAADKAIETPQLERADGVIHELLAVRSSDVAKARLQVVSTATGLHGKVVSDQQQVLTVNLPAQNVEQFKTQLAGNLKVQTLPGAPATGGGGGSARGSLAKASAPKLGATGPVALRKSADAKADQTNAIADAVLEIRILPLEK